MPSRKRSAYKVAYLLFPEPPATTAPTSRTKHDSRHGSVRQIKQAIHQLLGARKYSYHIVSYGIVSRNDCLTHWYNATTTACM